MHRNTNNTRDGTFAELSKFIELERILRKTRFRAAEPKNVIRFQSLSFLDPLFVFPFDPFVFHGGFSIFLKDFPLDWTILVTETTFIRRNTRSDCFPNATFSFRFYPPIFHYIPPVFSSNAFRFSIGCNDAEASFTTFRNLIRFQKLQFNFFHRSFVSSSKDFRSDPFVAVHRNEKQTFMQFRNGCLDSEKEMEFLCRPAETTCTVEWGGNLENGNSVSFDFFQRGRYRVSAKGIVDSRNCLDGG